MIWNSEKEITILRYASVNVHWHRFCDNYMTVVSQVDSPTVELHADERLACTHLETLALNYSTRSGKISVCPRCIVEL
jgi:hypothetical protein